MNKMILAALAALVLSACASTGGGRSALTVEQRAEQRVQSMVDRDFARTYQFLTPAYRGVHGEEAYTSMLRQGPTSWKEGKVISKECNESGERCTLRVQVKMIAAKVVPGMPAFPVTATRTENWIRVDGQWYYSPRR